MTLDYTVAHSQIEADKDQTYTFSCWVKSTDTRDKWVKISAPCSTKDIQLTPKFIEDALHDTYKITYTYGRTTFYGDEFWSVNMLGLDIDDAYQQRIEWCIATLGPSSVKSTVGRWYSSQSDNRNAALWFRNESDRTVFTLRWS